MCPVCVCVYKYGTSIYIPYIFKYKQSTYVCKELLYIYYIYIYIYIYICIYIYISMVLSHCIS